VWGLVPGPIDTNARLKTVGSTPTENSAHKKGSGEPCPHIVEDCPLQLEDREAPTKHQVRDFQISVFFQRRGF